MKNFCYLLFITITFNSCAKQGIEGKKSLIDMLMETPGSNCPNGGYKIMSGVDQDNNGTLESSEIHSTKFICNGNNSLSDLIIESAGANCPTGGYKINTGIDLNGNKVLEGTEILNSQYVCNGLTGANSLVGVVNEPAGTNCDNGGFKVNSGTDANGNGILEPIEIQNTSYVCNGVNGLNYLISVKVEPAGVNCPYGGYSFNTGIDVNKNGILSNDEVSKSTYMCDQSSIKEIRIPLDFSGGTSSFQGAKGLALINFNKANYVGLDSIVFVAKPYTAGEGNASIVTLINSTDNIVIAGSTLQSSRKYEETTIQYSPNLYNSLPDKPINIFLEVRSSQEGVYAYMAGHPFLILSVKK